MNTPATLSVLAALIGAAVAAVSLRIARLPGWAEARWFGAVTALASACALSNLGSSLATSAPVVTWLSRLQISLVLVQGLAWLRYAEVFGRSAPGRLERALEVALLVGAALALVPGLAFSGDVRAHVFTGWGVVYTDAIFTPGGFVLFASTIPAAGFILWRFVDAHRRLVPGAAVRAAAFATYLGLCVNDILVGTGAYDWPYLLDVGFILPLGLIYWATAHRFVASARDLDALRTRLEVLVEQRTRALRDAQEALVRAERLAALGQLGNGVAHQVSNPAAVVTANLRYLSGKFAAGAEEREAADDALAAMQRINDLVRRLADAGRIAAGPRSSVPVELSHLVERTLADARARLPGRLALDAALQPGLHVRARPEVLEQVLQSLIANAAEAVPQDRPGRIAVQAERRAGGIRLTVTDDGVGMQPEVLERAFEPFFTTKAASLGSGLGLPVSRGIVEVHGGALWLESAEGRGTTAVLVLPEAAAPPPAGG